MLKLLSIIICSLMANAASVPFIKPCKQDDHACIKASTIAALPFFTAGVPELGLQSADPIILNNIRADDKDLKLGFRNMKVTGVNKCKILDARRDLEKSTITLSVECPILVTGQYSMKGKLMFFVAEGDGDFKIKTDKVRIDMILKIKEVEIAGKKHWKVSGFDYTYDILEKAYIDLKNLFGGDQTKAQPFHEFLDHSWKEIITELGGPIIRETISREVDIIQKFFKTVPLSELVLS